MAKKSSKKQSELREILSTSIYILSILLSAYLIVHYVGQRTEVIGSSMEHTLSDRDNLIVDKISYRMHEPERFDVVVFPCPYQRDMNFVKRIIGLPGETVQIDYNGTIYIDGNPLDEKYGIETIVDPGIAVAPITLGDDEYFVMGDNRNNSKDSRWADVGNIKRTDIIGRAWVRIFPFNKTGRIR